jgi:hypothetical protein
MWGSLIPRKVKNIPSKLGFFNLFFEKVKECEVVLKEGPQFYCDVGIVICPCLEHFDSSTMNKDKKLLWVNLVGCICISRA